MVFDAGLLPQLLIHTAEYVPAPTLIVLVVSPVLHLSVPDVHALADKVTFSVPHTGPVLPVIVGAVGTVPGNTIIVFEAGLLPQMFSHTAVYVPAPTLIVLVVSPVLHLSVPVVQALADKVTFSFAHTGPVLPVITGAVGLLNFCIVTGVELLLVPHVVVHVAV